MQSKASTTRESFDAAQVRVLELVATRAPLAAATLIAIVSLVEEQAEGMLCSILLLEHPQGEAADSRVLAEGAAPSLPVEYTRSIIGVRIGPDTGSCGTAAYRRERIITPDIETDSEWTNYRQLALPHGLLSSWSSPIFSPDGEVLGTFAMYYRKRGRTPTDEEIHWVSVATHLASIAIVHDRMDRALEKSEDRAQQLASLYNVASGINEALLLLGLRDVSEFFLAACRIAVEKGLAVAAWVGVYDTDADLVRPIATFGDKDGYIATLKLRIVNEARVLGPAGRAITTDTPAISNDFANDPNFHWRDDALKRGYRAGAAFPLRLGDLGKGVFAIYGGTAGFFREEEVRVLSVLGENISFAVEWSRRDAERRRLFEALREREEHLRLMHEIGEAMRASSDTAAALAGALRLLGTYLHARCAYGDVDADQDRVTIPYEYRDDEMPSLVGEYRLTQFAPTIADGFRRGGRAVVVRNVETELPAEEVASFVTIDVRAFICCSLIKNGSLRAMVAVYDRTPRDWTEGEVAIVSAVVERCWAAIEQRRAEEMLRQNEEGLRQAQKMEAVGQLAGGIAHDFNNLLSVILSYSSLIGDELPPDGELAQFVEEVKKASLRAGDLTRQLLTFSRQQILQPRVIDLNQILTSLEKMLTRLVPADVTTKIGRAESLGHVLADRSQIEQVVVNLVVNACDAMPKGGLLTIETRNETPSAMLVVRDTGGGMDEATIARIFEPFFTTKPRGKGTGLGLAMVYGFVTQSGGHIQVKSEPGKGTAFEISLPIVNDALDADDAHALSSSTAVARGTETVLVVEDVAQLRTILRSILERAGYKVLDAADGVAALAVADRYGVGAPDGGAIHLLLTDVVMPEMGGRELAERLAKTRPTTKVLYMSGYTEDSVLERGVLMNGLSFLAKPFTPDTLLRHVRAALDRPQSIAPRSSPSLLRILLVDDEDSFLMLTERVLKKRGYDVTSFASAKEALRVLTENSSRFDVLVTDVGMPEMGGFDLVEKARVAKPRLGVVITSGHFDDRDREKAKRIGVTSSLLEKPDTIEALGQRIDELIATQRDAFR